MPELDDAPRPEADPAPATDERMGPTRLGRLLGRGGAGTVFLAEMVEDRPYAARGAQVAVKVLHPGAVSARGGLERFRREAAIGSQLDHHAVVRTHEVGTQLVGPIPLYYLVLEYVEGRTLKALMTELKPVPEPLLRALGARIARALEAVHRGGVVHRDVKPANVLLTPEHQVKLMDLGTARLMASAEPGLTREGDFVGTLLYAAPEQLRGSAVGPAADLYALGVMLYEAATAVHPFADSQPQAVIRRHLEHEPERAGRLNPALTPLLEEAIHLLLAKDPGDRIGSAAEVAEALEQGEGSRFWRERERASRVSAERSHLRRVRVAARETELVGRTRELEELRGHLADARLGRGRVVLLEGEAGVGKTRLLEELVAAADAPALEPLHVLYGASPPLPAAGRSGALAESVRSLLGETSLEPALSRYLREMRRLVPAFASFLTGEPAPPGAQALSVDSLHAVFCSLARGLSQERPVLWILDDLHLASSDARAVVASLARIAADLRLLLVLAWRPDPGASAFAERLRGAALRRSTLGRLGLEHVRDLLAGILRSDDLALRLAPTLWERSDGNPYFLLETLRELRERGVLVRGLDGAFRATGDPARVQVPSTVRGLLESRLSEIRESDRELLEVAAVQGFRFDAGLVAAVLGRARLEVLQALAAIERRSAAVRAAGSVFTFDHHQLRDLLEGSLPEALRRELHALLADAMAEREQVRERDPAQVPGETALFLAEHGLRGGREAEALRWVRPALAHLAARFENEALLALAERALGAIGDGDPALRCDVRLRQADCLSLLGRRSDQREAIEEAAAIAAAAADPMRAARAQAARGVLLMHTSEHESARGVFEEALRGARASGDRETEGMALAALTSVLASLGDIEAGRAAAEQFLQLARETGVIRHEVIAESFLGRFALIRGEPVAARAHFERELALTREMGSPRLELNAVGKIGILALQVGDRAESRRCFERVRELSLQIGFRFGENCAASGLAEIAMLAGDYGTSWDEQEKALAIAREIEDWRGVALGVLGLGELLLLRGRREEARERIAEGMALTRGIGPKMPEVLGLMLVAEIEDASGNAAEADRCAMNALASARAAPDPALVARAALALARIRVGRGETEAALPLLIESERLVREGLLGDPGPLPAAYLALLGQGDASSVEVPAGGPALVRAEAHAVLARAGAGASHARAARDLLTRLTDHPDSAERARCRRENPVARRFPELLAAPGDAAPPGSGRR